MQEFKGMEISEIKKPESENFKKIKPENETNVEKVKDFWDNVFDKLANTVEDIKDKIEGKEFGAQYNTEKHMIDHTPTEDSEKGHWEGERGTSQFIPNENTETGLKAKEKLAEFGQDGIRFINGEPDFSKCSEATVTIDNMTENRSDYIGVDGTKLQGNFTQASIKCAEKWNEEARDGKSDWTARDVYNWRHENKCSWHERCDTRTMDLVPFEIHSHCKHLGGVSECKVRDAVNVGGEFDE